MDTTMQAIANLYKSEALFSSAHSALVFTFNFSMGYYDRPAMNKMAAPAFGTGKGLSGLDGAAQAGFIRAELQSMGLLTEAFLTARIAPRSTVCECRHACCSGHTPNREWVDAIDILSRHALSKLSGCLSHGQLRKAIVQRYFGVDIGLSEAADKCGVNKNTATDHNAKITAAFKDEEAQCMELFEDRLVELGIVESE